MAGCGSGGQQAETQPTFYRSSSTIDESALTGESTTTSGRSGGPSSGPGEPAPPGGDPCSRSAAKSTVAYRTIDGVAPDLTSLDVYPPNNACSAPVVMWVHGGGFQSGDKANQVRDKVTLFNSHGWVFISVNYRLSKPDKGAAQFPDHYDDVAAAVRWAKDNVASYGGDPGRIALLGHSAGADIVANVATNPAYLSGQGLDLSALRCAGPLDTEGFDKQTAEDADPEGEKAQWRVALGNNPDYLVATSPTRLVAGGLGIPPIIGVVRGTDQRQQIETGFLDALTSAGVPTTAIDARALTHNEVSSQIGAPGDTVMTPPLVGFLNDCLA
jgi:acetyl esterase/lipase